MESCSRKLFPATSGPWESWLCVKGANMWLNAVHHPFLLCPLFQAFPQLPLAGGECCPSAVVIMKKTGWGQCSGEGALSKGGETLPCTLLLPQHNVWHIVGAQQILAE